MPTTMKERGFENDNEHLNEIERSYLFGALMERKIEAIKAVRHLQPLDFGLKDAKDLVEIWVPPAYHNEMGIGVDVEYVLNLFGYRKIKECPCPSHDSIVEWREVGQFAIRIAKFCPECGQNLGLVCENEIPEEDKCQTIERKLRPRSDYDK
jgi:hypothetical protein